MSEDITVLPELGSFAVVRVNALAMVEHLDDPLATAAARAMRPKKYLVYLDDARDLPLPSSRWCRFEVFPVATTLRPLVPELGITPDMVMPIHPNTDRLRGRPSVCTKPPFPFRHCYFWFDSQMTIRLPLKRPGVSEGYDNGASVKLIGMDRVHFIKSFRDDMTRMGKFVEWKRQHGIPDDRAINPSSALHRLSGLPPPQVNNRSLPTRPPPLPTLEDIPEAAQYFPTNIEEDEAEWHARAMAGCELESLVGSDAISTSGTDDYDAAPDPTFKEFFVTNAFGWEPDPMFQFIPLVDASLDICNHISEDEIGSPAELWKEQETITSIIKDSIRRRHAERTRHPSVHSQLAEFLATLPLPHSHSANAHSWHRAPAEQIPSREMSASLRSYASLLRSETPSPKTAIRWPRRPESPPGPAAWQPRQPAVMQSAALPSSTPSWSQKARPGSSHGRTQAHPRSRALWQ